MGTTLPACTHWVITVQHWCHSAHCTSSSLCFPVSFSKLSVKLKTPCHGQKDPYCVVVFLADWLRFISHCSSSSEVMLKCCATVATPSAALQRVCAETNPFISTKLLYVETGEQLLPLVTATLGWFWHFFFFSVRTTTSQTREGHPPWFSRETRRFPFDFSCIMFD